MSHFSTPILPFPGEPKAPIFLPQHDPVPAVTPLDTTYAEEIIGTLRNAITAGASALDPILNAIAEAAQTLTAATGAALALRRKGAVICCARSGDTGPDLGAVVQEDSGISGECLRGGLPLRCDDTQKDYRVNPDVCRKLALHSIALVPVRERRTVIGVLEVFSTRAYSFSEDHMRLLGRLAELVEQAQLKQQSPKVDAAPLAHEPHVETPTAALSSHAASYTESITDALPHFGFGESRGRYWIAGSAVVVLLALFSILGSRTHSAPQNRAVSSPLPTSTEITLGGGSLAQAAPAEASPKPSPSRASESEIEEPSEPVAESSSNSATEETEIPDVVTRIKSSSTKPAASATSTLAVSAGDIEAAPDPKLVTSSADSQTLTSVLAMPVSLPKRSTAVSEGVTGGSLEHKVQPTYPSQARSLRLEGAVVLQATVSEDGTVHDLKAVSGQPILAMAAVDAVRRWRYHPFLLDGQPITRRIEVTVNFKAP